MMKPILVLFAMLSCFNAMASQCVYCQTTMPLVKVDHRHYCWKHYCKKHKCINADGQCKSCDLEKEIAKGTVKCHFCDKTKNLHVGQTFGYNAGLAAFCDDHFCLKHNAAKMRDGVNNFVCPGCANEAVQKAADDTSALMSQPLKGLFGVELGSAPDAVAAQQLDESHYSFKPKMDFRGFSEYKFCVAKGKIIQIEAKKCFGSPQAANSELMTVLALMDRKYGSIRRRGFDSRHDCILSTTYLFGCKDNDVSTAAQIIQVTSNAPQNSDGRYAVTISAFICEDFHVMKQELQDRDIEAL